MLQRPVRYAERILCPDRGGLRLMLVLAALLVFIVLPQTVVFCWTGSGSGRVGYRQVFLTGLRAQASLGTFVFGVGLRRALRELVDRHFLDRQPLHRARASGARDGSAGDDPARASSPHHRHWLAWLCLC